MVALLTVHRAGDRALLEVLHDELFGPTVSDEQATRNLDAVVRLCAALRTVLRRRDLNPTMAAPAVPAARLFVDVVTNRELDPGITRPGASAPEVPRDDLADVVRYGLDVATDLLSRAAAAAGEDPAVFLQKLGVCIAAGT